jgi:hypothetical protein
MSPGLACLAAPGFWGWVITLGAGCALGLLGRYLGRRFNDMENL